jgi:ATP-dependent exoDNAse (exonuclease V) alpha subunit
MIEGKEQEFKVSEFSNHFLLAFCITIHCSQGQTYDEKYTIYDWNHPRFNNKLAYVALSRSTKYEYIQINEREFRE